MIISFILYSLPYNINRRQELNTSTFNEYVFAKQPKQRVYTIDIALSAIIAFDFPEMSTYPSNEDEQIRDIVYI